MNRERGPREDQESTERGPREYRERTERGRKEEKVKRGTERWLKERNVQREGLVCYILSRV
jgi:hypothetical protein